MGALSSKPNISYKILRESLLGSLIQNENDFREFFRKCKTFKPGISTTSLSISNTQAFFVVISGEVIVTMNIKDRRPIVLAIHRPGDVILFFHANKLKEGCVDGSLVYNDIKMSLQMKSTPESGGCLVLGMDYASLDSYVSAPKRENINLKKLSKVSLLQFLDLPCFSSLSEEQIGFLGPLLRLRLAEPAAELKLSADRDKSSSKSILSSGENSHKEGSVSLSRTSSSLLPTKPPPMWPIGIVLTGTCTAVGSVKDRDKLFDAMMPSELPVLVGSIQKPKPVLVSSSSLRSKDYEEKSVGSLESESIGLSVLESLGRKLGLELVPLLPGSVFGFESVFVKQHKPNNEHIVAIKQSIVGYLERDTLKSFFSIDLRFRRVVRRNFMSGVLDSVRPHVQLLNDFDAKSNLVLASLVEMASLQKDEFLYEKNKPSSYSYVIVKGLVKELDSSDDRQDERLHGFGSLVGEVALITGAPYFSTMQVVEPTTVLCFSKKTFERIYFNDKAKLAEINIRLAGQDVDLQPVLNHPVGNQLFEEFLRQDYATENIYFLNSVAKYVDIAERLRADMTMLQLQYLKEVESQTIHADVGHDQIDNGDSKKHFLLSPPNIVSLGSMDAHEDSIRKDFRAMQLCPVNEDKIMENIDSPKNREATCDAIEKDADFSSSNIPLSAETDSLDTDNSDSFVQASQTNAATAVSRPLTVPTPEFHKQGTNGTRIDAMIHSGIRRLESEPVGLLIDSILDVNTAFNLHPKASEKESPYADLPSQLRVYGHKFEKVILELKVVAGIIMDRYVSVNSEMQLNIGAETRSMIERSFDAWKEMTALECIAYLHKHIEEIVHSHTSKNKVPAKPSSLATIKMTSASFNHPSVHHSPPIPVIDVIDGCKQPSSSSQSEDWLKDGDVRPKNDYIFTLFRPAQEDIFKLLKNGPFIRFKLSPQFTQFLSAIRPYDSHERMGETPINRFSSKTPVANVDVALRSMYVTSFHGMATIGSSNNSVGSNGISVVSGGDRRHSKSSGTSNVIQGNSQRTPTNSSTRSMPRIKHNVVGAFG